MVTVGNSNMTSNLEVYEKHILQLFLIKPSEGEEYTLIEVC